MSVRDALIGWLTDVANLAIEKFDSTRGWLLLAVSAGLVVHLSYLQTHAHPAYEGGLFLQIAEVIRAETPRLPESIPYYTANGVPFAYPPLMFYVTALFLTLVPVDPVTFSLVAPGLVVVATTVPYFGLTRRLLPSTRQAGLATTLYTVAPPVLKWHISAGGVVRAPAAALTVVGLYTGLRTFESHEWRWTLATAVLFALVVLSHPVYPVFFGTTCLLFYAAKDRSVRGFVLGSVVVVVAFVLTAPWWLQVAATHGFDIFLGAAGTRTTLGGGHSRFMVQFVQPITRFEPVTFFYVLAFAGALYGVAKRRFLLPVWLVVSSYLLGEQRFTFVAGAMLSAVLVFEVLVPALRGDGGGADGTDASTSPTLGSATARGSSSERVRAVLVVAVVVISAVVVGTAFAGSALQTTHQASTTLPQTVDAADQDAMAWVQANTDEGAEFVVLGDAAEWVPYYTQRTILVTPWGTEWEGQQRFHYHLDRYTELSECPDATCLDRELSAVETQPDYLYIPKGEYTIRGAESHQSARMRRSLIESRRYDIVFENDGVIIVRVYPSSTVRSSHRPESAPSPGSFGHGV
ncbi:glycosyltransferase family 39 protein [Halolamina sp. CBA1230]|uniref:glycosyltransferase family 39 protein n=1 Tax=Halolamina sp. CBA1230 TaxID=1853690 RepID=UPI0009A24D4D|nr:glycosyltransferase family 39 protein [Halolamina sp. CBA1230]QKY18921.1 glycosyltransferase family 39 protein [Halolamina sp. CBA1230]